MSRTTISISTEVRDRLAAVAASRDTTMSALLETATRRLEREDAMRRVTESYERLAREDPDGYAEYVSEGLAWDKATASDGLGSAREEFPEYNS